MTQNRTITQAELLNNPTHLLHPLVTYKTPFLIHRMIIPSLLILGLIWFIAHVDTAYLLPLSMGLILILYVSWVSFVPVNKIVIDNKQKLFRITRRNPFQKILFASITLQFDEINSFTINNGFEIRLERSRYIINAELNDSIVIPITQTEDLNTARYIARAFTKIITHVT